MHSVYPQPVEFYTGENGAKREEKIFSIRLVKSAQSGSVHTQKPLPPFQTGKRLDGLKDGQARGDYSNALSLIIQPVPEGVNVS